MAIVVRYFSTSAAGAGDGTTWADRAAFFSAGAYSTVITAFDFSGSDSLEVRLGPGTYSAALTFQSSIFSVAAPRPANPLTIHGCDSNGDRIVPAEWNCCEGALPTTGFPVWSLGANRITLQNVIFRCIYVTGTTGASSVIWGAGVGSSAEYCRFEKTGNDTGFVASLITGSNAHSCHFIVTSTQFGHVLETSAPVSNCRIEGNASATSGNRRGMSSNTNAGIRHNSRNCICNCPGSGLTNTFNAASTHIAASEFTIVNCATASGAGIDAPSLPSALTGTQYSYLYAQNCMIANCSVGINTQNNAARILGNRLRNTTNYTAPTNSIVLGNYEAAGSDTDEFVDAANGDYRIKSTSIYWGKGIGAGDGPASGGTSRPLSPFYQGVIG